jgi:hypothetical protein
MMWGAIQQNADLDSVLSDDTAPWLVDDFLDHYVSWREEAASVQTAYDGWRTGEAEDEALAFAAYTAALDLEQHAADLLRESAERVAAAKRKARLPRW